MCDCKALSAALRPGSLLIVWEETVFNSKLISCRDHEESLASQDLLDHVENLDPRDNPAPTDNPALLDLAVNPVYPDPADLTVSVCGQMLFEGLTGKITSSSFKTHWHSTKISHKKFLDAGNLKGDGNAAHYSVGLTKRTPITQLNPQLKCLGVKCRHRIGKLMTNAVNCSTLL